MSFFGKCLDCGFSREDGCRCDIKGTVHQQIEEKLKKEYRCEAITLALQKILDIYHEKYEGIPECQEFLGDVHDILIKINSDQIKD